jgi:hypothetical protein
MRFHGAQIELVVPLLALSSRYRSGHSTSRKGKAGAGRHASVTYTPITPPSSRRARCLRLFRTGAAGHGYAHGGDPSELDFRVAPDFTSIPTLPKSEFLIPTALKMDLPTDIVLGKIAYPAGQDLAFPFSPRKMLSVYSGDFTVTVAVHPLRSVVPGKYIMHGVLRYQACDNCAMLPAEIVPVRN